MQPFPGFIGPTYQARSRIADAERCINLFPERVESGAGAADLVYYAVPGRSVFVSGLDQPIRALFTHSSRTFAIGGGTLYELSGSTAVTLGSVANDGQKAYIVSNGLAGLQLFIVSAGLGYIFALDTNTLTEISASGFPVEADMAAFADGYFFTLNKNSLQFQISDLEDGLTWDAADAGVRSQQSDPLKALVVDHGLVWLFGEQTSEVWYNSGAVAFPFQPVPDVFLEVGIGAKNTAVPFDNSVAWLGRSKDGALMVFRAEGFNPVRISTHAMEAAMSGYARTDDAYSVVSQEDGHAFLRITFPSANATWVYDAATQLWHERGTWNSTLGQFDADRVSCHVYALGRHLVGDRQTGTIYTESMDVYVDGDAKKRWLRRAPHVQVDGVRIVHRGFELRAEVGVGLTSGQGSDPQAMLRWSDDGGKTWSNEHWRSLGAIGSYLTRAIWRNLGMARDRVYEVSGSDPVKTALIGASLDLAGGVS